MTNKANFRCEPLCPLWQNWFKMASFGGILAHFWHTLAPFGSTFGALLEQKNTQKHHFRNQKPAFTQKRGCLWDGAYRR